MDGWPQPAAVEEQPRRPLLELYPQLRARLSWVGLGDLPTPVQTLERLGAHLQRDLGQRRGVTLLVKRDDLTHALYGGNKVRTLEVLLGDARSQGARRVFSTGAYGSNHATATVLHAPRLGLDTGVVLYPQPVSSAALENLRVTLSAGPRVIAVPHWSLLPLGMLRAARGEAGAYVMVPGGAVPLGALGYVSAALELGQQIEELGVPRPAEVVVGVGSNCTSAGLLVGFQLAARLGLGFRDGFGRPAPPRLVSVRVTPWPVTSPLRILDLARRCSQLLAQLAEDPRLELSWQELRAHFELDASAFGRGYGYATTAGLQAIAAWREHAGLPLDTTYSAKSAAAVATRLRSGQSRGPVLYWATKSSAPLPPPLPTLLRQAPAAMRAWLERAERSGPDRPARHRLTRSGGRRVPGT